MTNRLRFLLIIFIAAFAVIIVRLFSWQVLRAEELAAMGKGQLLGKSNLVASRGNITSSDNFPLAASSASWLVWASLPEIEDPALTAHKLSAHLADVDKPYLADVDKPYLADVDKPYLADPNKIDTEEKEEKESILKEKTVAEESRLLGLLTRKDVVWVPLKDRIDSKTKEIVESMGISGIGFDLAESRVYPEASMAAHVLGFVGQDAAGSNKGYFGIEGKYDISLSGRSGNLYWEKDALGSPILSAARRGVNALDGANLKTHIDRSIQFLIEKNLSRGIEKYGALAGTVIVMRPQDGAVLGMASYPSYAPASFSQYTEQDFLNPAISQSFEPGSVFKILVMAAAIDSGAVSPKDRCNTCSGPRRIAEYTIGTWDGKYYPDSTPGEIIQHSDNVGMIWAAEKLGKDRLYDYLSAFGIGKLTDIDLQGEGTPNLREKGKWGAVDLATASFGQGIAVTPIQLVSAAAVLANKGKIAVPQVVDKIIADSWEEDIKPVIGERVISEAAAAEITAMMVNAVAAGEAKWAAPKEFVIAGKTGTAQIPVAGHYDAEKTIASFIGFAPAANPAFVMLVMLREPKSSPWAAETAAPLWFDIAKELFTYLNLAPN